MKSKCIIFGASKTGNVAYRLLKDKYEVIGFADNDKKMGRKILQKRDF